MIGVTLYASAFAAQSSAHIQSTVHTGSQWRIVSSSSDLTAIVYESAAPPAVSAWSGDLLVHVVPAVLPENTRLWAQVRFRDQFGVAGEWSELVLILPRPVAEPPEIVLPEPELNELRLGPVNLPDDLKKAAVESEDKINEIIRYIRRMDERLKALEP